MSDWILRVLVAAGLLGSAWVHLVVWFDWAGDTDVIGPLFLVNLVAGVVIAVAVLIWRHWLPVLAAVGFGAATLLAYWLSVTVGLFGVQEQFATSEEVWGVITEAGCIVFSAALLAARSRRRAAV
ncbi:hypothetical protein [Saccharopolyspora spinosa]|uniref:Uncharacterized protein n=1 Tax=Saccharopolyspora spinosa TaxID=60894 RepID=A0A2N3Y2H9_SACSN|nr:hypothetical protein [Saccharopolyspora spinosa]PKW17124.1 hypothetical protein A8926_5056 [Saccharopolyspora spinosa]